MESLHQQFLEDETPENERDRFGKHGLAINLIDSEKSLNILNEIERHFGKPIIKLDAHDMDAIEKIQKD